MNHFQVRLAAATDRLPIQHMLELYLHDLSKYWDYELDSHGLYGYRLDKYWTDSNCHAFVFQADGRYAGFALVDDAVSLPENAIWMSQFFVVRRHRRKGLATLAAGTIFDAIRGKWEIGQFPGNAAATAFWRKAIQAYTSGEFIEYQLDDERWRGPLQCFDNTLNTDRANR